MMEPTYGLVKCLETGDVEPHSGYCERKNFEKSKEKVKKAFCN
jgi:hypothetical protein